MVVRLKEIYVPKLMSVIKEFSEIFIKFVLVGSGATRSTAMVRGVGGKEYTQSPTPKSNLNLTGLLEKVSKTIFFLLRDCIERILYFSSLYFIFLSDELGFYKSNQLILKKALNRSNVLFKCKNSHDKGFKDETKSLE